MENETNFGYPLVPNSHGIDLEKVFPPLNRKLSVFDEITTESGQKVIYDIKPDQIELYDQTNNRLSMTCSFNREKEQVEFYLVTKDKENHRHPDMFAGKFIKACIEYLQKRGNVINHVLCHWSKSQPTNLIQFIQNLKDGMSVEEAAKNTWTGKIVTELGFTQTETIEPGSISKNLDINSVLLRFSKPQNVD